jgi:hypothetical protein
MKVNGDKQIEKNYGGSHILETKCSIGKQQTSMTMLTQK